MAIPKYGAAVDSNQKEIVDALRKAGCSVVVIGTPVDLLCGYRARNFLLEVKDPDKPPSGRKKTPAQVDFFKEWKGQVRIVESAEEAIDVVRNSYRAERFGETVGSQANDHSRG